MLLFLSKQNNPVDPDQTCSKACFPVLLLALLLLFPCSVSAEKTVDSLLQTLSQTRDTKIQADLMLNIAREYYYTDIHEAIRFAGQANDLFRQNNNMQGLARSITIMGAGYYALGDYGKAEDQFGKALILARESGDSLQTAKILNNLANIKFNTGELLQAVTYFNQAGKIFIANNNQAGAIAIENSLSSIYRSIGSYDKAHEHLTKAISLADRAHDERMLGTVYYNLGALLIEEGRFKEALAAGTKSYELRIRSQHMAGQVKSLISLGSIFHETGNDPASDTCYRKALTIARTIGLQEDEAYILMHLGYLDLENDRLDSATGYFMNSMQLAEDLKDPELQLQLHKYLYGIDSLQGNFQSALTHLQHITQIESDLNISESEKKLEELENLFSLAKKENTQKEGVIKRSRSLIICLIAGLLVLILITILIIQQVLLRSQRKVAELTQENLRSQMNPHFIFNILNSIHAYILNNDTKASSEYLLKFSHLLRLTLDNSRNKLATIQDELHALRLYLELEAMRLDNKLEYNIIVDEEIDTLMFKIPPLLLQPYVENSILHGLTKKEGKGRIEIRMDYIRNGIHCSITDNGIGRRKAESMKGEKEIKRKSHGSAITESRLKLLNTIYGRKIGVRYTDMVDEKNNCLGTKVEFNLPILN